MDHHTVQGPTAALGGRVRSPHRAGPRVAWALVTILASVTIAISGATPALASGGWVLNDSLPAATASSLNAVTCPGTGDCYAVGADGVILTTTDGGTTAWSEYSVTGLGYLYGVACTSDDDCDAVGQLTDGGGAIATTIDGGSTWTLLPTCGGDLTTGCVPADVDSLSAVTCPSTTICYAVGMNEIGDGAIIGTTDGGTTWSDQTVPTDVYSADGVACSGPTDCFTTMQTVSDDVTYAVMATTNGSTWAVQSSSDAPSGAVGIACLPSAVMADAQCVATGDNFALVTSNGGSTWSTQSVPAGLSQLNGVTCMLSLDCFSVGELDGGGAVVVGNGGGSTWSTQSIPTGIASLSGGACDSSDECYAVGSGTSTTGAVVLSTSTAGPATVTGVSPATGPLAGGTAVTITGTGFTGTTGAGSVTFGGIDATNYTVVSDGEITATSPAAGAAGAVDVIVTNSIGASGAVPADQFTYTAPAAVASNTNSTITFSANPALLSGPGGAVTFNVLVTVKDASDVPISDDSVSLTSSPNFVTPSGFSSPETTNSSGVATFSFNCPAGYCTAGETIAFSATDTGDLSLGPIDETIAAAAVLNVTPGELPGGTVGIAYSRIVAASGGTSPYSYSVLTGSLPTGLILNQTSGAITGTPTANATYDFTITATDSATPTPNTGSTSYTVTIAAVAVLVIAPPTLPNGVLGASSSQLLTTSGGTAPYTYAISSGLSPPGLTLSSTGLLSGTPTTPGDYNFFVTATDALGATVSSNYTIDIFGFVAPTLPNGTVNTPYNQIVTATGGTAPYNYVATDLPTGFTINPSTGQLTGMTSAPGPVTFTVTATDDSDPPLTASRSYTINFAAPLGVAPSFTADTPPTTATVGSLYSYAFVATGIPSAMYSLSGTPPGFLSINASTGVVSGTPTTGTNSFNYAVRASNGVGTPAVTAVFSVTVSPGGIPLAWSPSPLKLGQVVIGSAAAGGGVKKTMTVTNLSNQTVTLDVLGPNKSLAATGNWKFVVVPSTKPGYGPRECSSGLSLATGASCVYHIMFYSDSLGAFSGTVSLGSTDAGGALPAAKFAFTGTGVAPLAWSPSPLVLGNVVAGDQGGVTETLTVTNLTSEPVTLGALGYDRAVGFTGNGDITYEISSLSTCVVEAAAGWVIPGTPAAAAAPGTVLAGGTSCDFVVRLTYSALGRFSATLSLASTVAAGGALSDATLPIAGTGVAPLAWSPSPLDLGNVVVGDKNGVTESLTVTNVSSKRITLGGLGLDKGTAGVTGNGVITLKVLSSSTCVVEKAASWVSPGASAAAVGSGTVLDGGASCNFDVHITYSALGPFSATLSIASADQAGGALSAAVLSITGTGVAPLAWSPSPLQLGPVVVGSAAAGGGLEKTLTVTNHTNQAVTLGGLGLDRSVATTGKWKLAVVPPGSTKPGHGLRECSSGLSLGGGASCAYHIMFYSDALGAFSGTVRLASTDSAGAALPAATFTLTGTGVAPLAWSPSPLDLGNVVVGNQGGVTETLTVTNLTSEPITLGALGFESTTGAGVKVGLALKVSSSSTCVAGTGFGNGGTPGTVLAGGASCDFVVLITYSNLGPVSATFSLASTDAAGAALLAATLPITGTGIAPQLTLTTNFLWSMTA